VIELGRVVAIHDLKRRGLSVSTIARKTGLDRKTVRKHLDRGGGAGATGEVPLAGRVITVDALHTTRDTARSIVETHGPTI